ncbi:MAG: helix-turn-helix domain-containing protein [Oscillospiraceae bacterium]|nr:helix-turn-helix domain-containing protein [Oscillospiraceae bacterium]
MSYLLIQQVVCGELQAIEAILHIYDRYINSMVTFEMTDVNGNTIQKIDEDMKIQIQMKLIEAIQTKWRNLIV